jgi:hypothetical protein
MLIYYCFHGWLIFARVIALFMFVWPYVRPHILCMQLVFCRILFIFGILVGHDLSMRILYKFHGWLIFARVKALFMFVWPYVRLHILCTQLVICLLLDFIHIWYLGWPWSEHAHIPISQIVYFCESYSPFHVYLTICPFAHLVYATSHLSLVGFIHIWYLGWPWSEHAHIIPISRMVDFCKSWSPFHVCLTICPFAHLVYAINHLSFVAFYSYLVSWLAMIWACAYYTDFKDGWFLRQLP